MKAQANVNLHNRFDIEVRDAVTGELKQEAKAYNIVLNNMWTRLCGGSTYFTSIQFGTGTGTLDPTRTTLFTFLGGKAAVDDTLVKAIPNSSWKRKVVLAPEEFVGSTLSEVGVAYQTTTGGLVTHAMLEDSEGNPITITKTATDVITIYATVFVTFSTGSTDLHFTHMPSKNMLVNYLIGGATFQDTQNLFQLGQLGGTGNITMEGLKAASAIGVTASPTYSSDVPNKKRTAAITRFGTTVANGHAKELAFAASDQTVAGVFRMSLPSSGVFSGQVLSGVPIGTGDGVTKVFEIPSNHVRAGSEVVKLNNVETSLLSIYPKPKQINAVFSPRNQLLGSLHSIRVSRDSKVLAAGYESTAPHVQVYDIINDILVPRANPVASGNTRQCGLSADGSVLAVPSTVSPYLIVFDWIDSAWVQRANPTVPGSCHTAALSDNGNVLIAGGTASPYVYTFDWNGTAWVPRPTPSTVPPSNVNEVVINLDGTKFGVAHLDSPYFSVYDWDGSAWIKRANPTSLPPNYCVSIAASENFNTVAVGFYNNPNFSVYDWSGSAWTKRPNAPRVPTGGSEGKCVALSTDGNTFAWGTNVSPFFSVSDWDGAAWTERTSPDGIYSSNSYKGHLSSDGTWAIMGSLRCDLTSRKRLIEFDTAPAAGVAITADYTVDGVHKTDQYVIDVGFSIQFGEPV